MTEPAPPPAGWFDRWRRALFGLAGPPPSGSPRWHHVLRCFAAWVPVIAILVLPPAALLLHREVGRRALDLAERSGRSLAQGDYRMALVQAESAHRLRASDPRVERARAVALAAVRDPRAVGVWNEIAADGNMTAADRRARAAAVVRLAGEEEFLRLTAALAAGGEAAEAARWRGWRASLRADRSAAERELREAFALEPTAERRMDLARLLADSREPGGRAEAAALVEEAGGGVDSLDILAFGLEALPEAGAATRLDWSRRAFLHPAADNPALLPAATALAAEGHEPVEQLVARLFAVFRGRPPAERAGFARWLSSGGRPRDALAFATEEDARTCHSAFLARADALSRETDWEGLLRLVEAPSPAGEVALAVLRSRAERGLGRAAAADLSVRRALTLSASRGQLPETLAQLDAEGRSALADAVLLDLCDDPQLADLTLRVARWRFGQRGEPRLCDEALRRAAAISPGAPSVLDLQRRGRLLTGEPVDVSDTAAAWSAEPANVDFQLTHALALLRAGDPAGARMLLSPIEAGAPSLSAGQKAILAAVLSASGSSGQAGVIIRTIRPQQLSDGEYRLVYGTLPGAQAGPD